MWCWDGEVTLAPLTGLAPISAFLAACRGGGTCRRTEAFAADGNYTVLLAQEGC